MKPATSARGRGEQRQLLAIDAVKGRFEALTLDALPSLLRPGDLLVANDAATLPGSLHTADGALELRLLERHDDGSFLALLFGPGDWRLRTEDRPAPPVLKEGQRLRFRSALEAEVVAVDGRSPRLVQLRIHVEEDALWPKLYAAARPVQYAYLGAPLELWDVQTAYASRPWAAEPPSAGLPLSWSLLLALKSRGVGLAQLTHAAGLSSTGDAKLDALLPLAERFDIPEGTVQAIAEAKRRGGRILAVGTTVVRALEGCAELHGGDLVAGRGRTSLRIGPGFRPRVADGLLSGVHEPSESHYDLLAAFAPRALLDAAHRFAEGQGFLTHEFGDSALLLPGAL